jgi:hypothetical protein
MDVVNADIAGANICPCSRNPTYGVLRNGDRVHYNLFAHGVFNPLSALDVIGL